MNDESKKKDISSDAHDNLVKSLESIKDLLLQSETKISAARESIAKAGMSQHSQSPKATSAESEPGPGPEQAPLFDLGAPNAEMESKTEAAPAPEPTTGPLAEVPLLDDVVIPGAAVETAAAAPSSEPESEIDASAIEAELATWQQRMEQQIHDTLIKRMVRVESELKKQLAKDIAALRKKLTKK
jgi:hypothetical protein